ncbi:uncharacterized protein TNCV_3768851 [Trichonephila clavipes]|nr:uncharacterized protein TNCV_3768851 [Trichonephila clavipes]
MYEDNGLSPDNPEAYRFAFNYPKLNAIIKESLTADRGFENKHTPYRNIIVARSPLGCLEIVCGTIATPTSARIVERVTVGATNVCHTILRSSLLVVFLVAPDPVFRAWVPSRVYCSQQFLTAHSERSTWPATRRVDQPAVFIPVIRPFSNSLNCKKCLLARLPGMFSLPNLPTIGG